jgi:hypothetical protein
MLNGSPYLRNGASQCCALCNAPFIIEDGHVMCWRETAGGTTAAQGTPTSTLRTPSEPSSASGGRCHETL